jgi:hypothetical protein
MPEIFAVITALILERPLCMECVVSKSALTLAEVGAALARIQKVLHVHIEQGRCWACGTIGSVVYSERP